MTEVKKYPIPTKEVEIFLKLNPKIKDALDLFEISQEQYVKAMQSIEPHVTTSNKIIIEVPA